MAAQAGVSVATASKALNDQGRMTAETRERIRETARRLGSAQQPRRRACLRRRSFTRRSCSRTIPMAASALPLNVGLSGRCWSTMRLGVPVPCRGGSRRVA
ncbi:LacI family DNA-binding transcriptional regulator [Mesorhizobium calcicola]|uniref:LacI family DNA-binding transcriptional regulator n=1 Tax=Mesorhizobium calcicola TaxID=1300310 RepID=A0ABW4WES9_9HYPH